MPSLSQGSVSSPLPWGWWSCHCGSAITNPARNHKGVGLIPGLAQWVKDLALLWLWFRLAAAAPIRPLAWELPYAAGVALKRKKNSLFCIPPFYLGLGTSINCEIPLCVKSNDLTPIYKHVSTYIYKFRHANTHFFYWLSPYTQ